MSRFFEPVENPMIRDSFWYNFERFEPKPVGECAGCKEEIMEDEEIIEVLEFDEKVIIHEDATCCKQFLVENGICKYAGED